MTFAAFSFGIIGLINNVAVPLIFALAFLAFIWGVFNYFILGGADETKQKAGREFVLWGLIGMAVLFSVWGLVNVILNTFRI